MNTPASREAWNYIEPAQPSINWRIMVYLSRSAVGRVASSTMRKELDIRTQTLSAQLSDLELMGLITSTAGEAKHPKRNTTESLYALTDRGRRVMFDFLAPTTVADYGRKLNRLKAERADRLREIREKENKRIKEAFR